MRTPTIPERCEYVLYFNALDSIKQAIAILEYLQCNNSNFEYSIKRSLLVAFFVSYGKPFKRSDGFDKLNEAFVSLEKLELHREILTFRDKLIAHQDIGGRIEEIDEFMFETELNVINGKAHWEGHWVLPTSETLKHYLDHCKTLSSAIEMKTFAICNSWHQIGLFNLPEGVYRLNIRDPNNPRMFFKTDKMPTSLNVNKNSVEV